MEPMPPDPRVFMYIEVRYLEIDMKVQRDVYDDRADHLAYEWDWLVSEAATVTPDPGNLGVYFVIEAQHRTRAIMKRGTPDTLVPCMVIPTELADTPEKRAAIARKITLGRRGHSSVERWKIAVVSEQMHEVAANKALSELHLRIGVTVSSNTVNAAAAVARLIRTGRRTPEDGADLLSKTLIVLIGAYPDYQDPVSRRQTRFDAVLIETVGYLIAANPGIDVGRLINVMGSRPIRQWIAEADSGLEVRGWRAVARVMSARYNKNLRRSGKRIDL
jgi:hypothetical protein